MASIKSIFVFAFLALNMVTYNPTLAQTRSTLDFWLTFAELLTEDVVNKIATAQLPSLPNFQFPSFPSPPSLPSIPTPVVNIPDHIEIDIPIPSFPSLPNQQQLDYNAYLAFLAKLYPGIFPIPQPPQPTPAPTGAPITLPTFPTLPTVPTVTVAPTVPTAAPVTPDPNGCKPDKVKIIVVEDCDEKKSSESSDEDSDEVDIVVPYPRRGRYQYRNSNK